MGTMRNLIGSNCHRPADAELIVVLFDGCSHGSGNANAVAAHNHGLGFPFLIKINCTDCFAVFGAEFKDLTHLDPRASWSLPSLQRGSCPPSTTKRKSEL